MKKQPLVLCFALFMAASPLATAKNAKLRSTSPPCPLSCPPGLQVSVYSWELHPDRTIYDEKGQKQVAPDAVWKVSCKLRCEYHEVNEETKSWDGQKEVCDSGAEPAPYVGPWRITGEYTRECAARTSDGCKMQCYEIKKPPPPGKGKGKGAPPGKKPGKK
jgi:hypothetical protein